MGSRDEGSVEDRALELTSCANCGAENVGEGRYCGVCGRSLPEPPALADAPPTAAEMPAPRAVRPGDASVWPGMGGVRSEMLKSDATRYICAAVHASWRLRERIVQEVVNEVYKAPPRSPDVDLVTVVAHTIAARRRQAVCDLLLTILGLTAAFLFVLPDAPPVPGLVALIGMAWLVGSAGAARRFLWASSAELQPRGLALGCATYGQRFTAYASFLVGKCRPGT